MMKFFLRNLFLCLLVLALVSLVRIYTSDIDYEPLAKAVSEGSTTVSHDRKLIALLSVALCFAVAGCMTLHHLYRRESSSRKFAERRLAQAKAQLGTTAQRTNALLTTVQQMRNMIATPDVSPKELGEQVDEEVRSLHTQQIALTLTSLLYADITERFRKSATDRRVHITRDDWSALTELFSQQLPQLIVLLQSNQQVTLSERRVCMLTLLDLGTLETASILGLQSSSVSSAKKTLLEKLTGDASASAKDLKARIISLLATA